MSPTQIRIFDGQVASEFRDLVPTTTGVVRGVLDALDENRGGDLKVGQQIDLAKVLLDAGSTPDTMAAPRSAADKSRFRNEAYVWALPLTPKQYGAAIAHHWTIDIPNGVRYGLVFWY